jgi:hypothetical protein
MEFLSKQEFAFRRYVYVQAVISNLINLKQNAHRNWRIVLRFRTAFDSRVMTFSAMITLYPCTEYLEYIVLATFVECPLLSKTRKPILTRYNKPIRLGYFKHYRSRCATKLVLFARFWVRLIDRDDRSIEQERSSAACSTIVLLPLIVSKGLETL